MNRSSFCFLLSQLGRYRRDKNPDPKLKRLIAIGTELMISTQTPQVDISILFIIKGARIKEEREIKTLANRYIIPPQK